MSSIKLLPMCPHRNIKKKKRKNKRIGAANVSEHQNCYLCVHTGLVTFTCSLVLQYVSSYY
jgi:hypothetical protein